MTAVASCCFHVRHSACANRFNDGFQKQNWFSNQAGSVNKLSWD